jgi:hypothetical protein
MILVYAEIFCKNTRKYQAFHRNLSHLAAKLGQSATPQEAASHYTRFRRIDTNVSDQPSLSPAHWSRVACLVAKKGRQCEIPPGWTDLAQDDPLTTLVAGKSWFRAADLLELAHLVKASADEENPIMEILVYSVCPSRLGFLAGRISVLQSH